MACPVLRYPDMPRHPVSPRSGLRDRWPATLADGRITRVVALYGFIAGFV
jgi:hypothetical protein